jgi:hypothetical protein
METLDKNGREAPSRGGFFGSARVDSNLRGCGVHGDEHRGLTFFNPFPGFGVDELLGYDRKRVGKL